MAEAYPNVIPEKKSARRLPKITKELKSGRFLYYYTCDICQTRYGPKAVRRVMHDDGESLFKDDYTACPSCGQFVCTFKCFDRFKKLCKRCAAP